MLSKNSYILPFRVGYEPDFLLKNRDKTNSKKKLYEAQIHNQKSAYISLLSDVASVYINILLLDYLIDKQIKILEDKSQNLLYSTGKFKFGVIDFIQLNDKKEQLETQKIIYERERLNSRKLDILNLLEQSKDELKSTYQQVKEIFPELSALAMTFYDDSNTQVVGMTIELD